MAKSSRSFILAPKKMYHSPPNTLADLFRAEFSLCRGVLLYRMKIIFPSYICLGLAHFEEIKSNPCL